MSSSKDSALYGIPRSKKPAKEIDTSTNRAFASQLTSLIASSASDSTSRTTAGRARPKKEDIFSTHNRNTKKRAAKDLEDVDFSQKHTTSGSALDETTWRRTKRKMEEKARLYAAMKRGDVEDADEKYAVDFDRKWAEKEGKGIGSDNDTSSDNGDSDDDQDELVEYTDEFGRTRKGTRADAAREERSKRATAAAESDRFRARPDAPTNIIHGDTVQAAAFNPDETIAEKMAQVAAKRDKEDSPPPDEHFNGSAEVRSKGVGFFQFSADAEERKRQMEELEKERQETEKMRSEKNERKEARKKEVEERRKAIAQKRSKAKADKFLNGLMGEMSKEPAYED
ncbi:hypothetical protein K490DRAFT_66560 [Saccharata proteae CBS 121410]|uniref:Uncharacterized protein n=1 Tax=Saccharata proteae CBS 121410 TaxID=1314787 RepID=A0A9P4HVP3_9PEZI|nr:hypothetical protein K490DRAFT_66560 [Saccharata proteae CBS 121410]